MSEFVEIEKQPNAAGQPAVSAGSEPAAGYPLDWKTQEIDLVGGRFSHVIRRPTDEEIYEREESRKQVIPIAKDGAYGLPDPTIGEDADAELYDKIIIERTGYVGEPLKQHKARVVSAMWEHHDIDIDEDEDVFAEEVAITHEIGAGIEPDFVIRHILRQPTEAELTKYNRTVSQNVEVRPGKRGRQNLVSKTNLRKLAAFYDAMAVRVEGATVDGRTWTDVEHQAFVNSVDPVTKRAVMAVYIDNMTGKLSD